MARAAADLDCSNLLLRHTVNVTTQNYALRHLTRSLRGFARGPGLTTGVIDTQLARL